MPLTNPLTREDVFRLQKILEQDYGRTYSFEEVSRIGRGLINFYSLLADNELGIGHKNGVKPP